MQTSASQKPVTRNHRTAVARSTRSRPVVIEALAEAAPIGDTELKISWGISALLVIPGLALLLYGLAAGLGTLKGIFVSQLAVAYLVFEALYLQPRLAFRLPGLELERVALEFARNRMYSRTLAELAGHFQSALLTGLGISESMLVLQGSHGQLSFGADEVDLKAVRSAPRALEYLERHGGLMTRDALAEIQGDDMASAATALLDVLEADIVLSFCQDGQLLGFAAFDYPGKNSDYAEAFLDVVGESMTSGLINQHLRQQAGGHEAMTQVFALAQAMQNSLLPDSQLEEVGSVQLQGWSDPAEQCGGDIWAWHNLGRGKLLLFVGDATGHGVSPATLAAAVSGALAAHATAQGTSLEPGPLLSDLNRLVRKVGLSHHTMSAFAAVFDSHKKVLTFANAGHNPPFLWRGIDDTGLKVIKVAGSMLGSADELEFEQGSRPLMDEDMLFLFSDGIVEAGEPHLPQLGSREFRKILVECAGKSVGDACDHMKSRVMNHLGDVEAGDDMTFVALRFREMSEVTR